MPGGFGRGYRWTYRMTGLPRWGRGFSCPPYSPCPPDVLYPYGPGVRQYMPFAPYRELTEEEELRMMEEDLSILESEREALEGEIDELEKKIEEKKRKGGE